MASLTFAPLLGDWHCGTVKPTRKDPKKEEVARHMGIQVTKITSGATTVIFYASPLMIDLDGSANAYGPPGSGALEKLSCGGNAGQGWFGVVAYTPSQVAQLNKEKGFTEDRGPKEKLRIDTSAPGYIPPVPHHPKSAHHKGGHPAQPEKHYPLFQRSDQPRPGFYVSCSSKAADKSRPRWDQRRYIDAATVPFGALGGLLGRSGGVVLEDKCVSFCVERGREATYPFKDTGPGGGNLSEVSLAAAMTLGAKNGGDNEFVCAHFALPRSMSVDPRTLFGQLAAADNADDLRFLVAKQLEVGPSGHALAELNKRQAAAAHTKLPPNYDAVAAALKRIGF